jgi:zinc transport system substrate-binding protein
MNRFILIRLALGLVVSQLAAGASLAADPAAGASMPVVYAVNHPLAWMAERIGGDAVHVVFPVPDGVDPAHWQPTPETVLDYQGADLVLLNGAGYAGWTRFASLSPVRLVDTTRGLEDRLVPAGDSTHSHGPRGAHDHGDVASHTWLDPTLAAAQARAVAAALARLAPGSTADFDRRLNELVTELETWDRAMSEAFSALAATQFLYSHPVYQYLDARYRLDGLAVTWEPDTEPGAAAWRALEAAVDPGRRTLMLWEAAPLGTVSARLEAMGIRPVVFETGANPERREGYELLLERNWEGLRGALRKPVAPGQADPGLPRED